MCHKGMCHRVRVAVAEEPAYRQVSGVQRVQHVRKQQHHAHTGDPDPERPWVDHAGAEKITPRTPTGRIGQCHVTRYFHLVGNHAESNPLGPRRMFRHGKSVVRLPIAVTCNTRRSRATYPTTKPPP